MQIDSKSYVVLFDLDASGNPVTQSVVGVTDSSGNAVTGIISVGDPAPFFTSSQLRLPLKNAWLLAPAPSKKGLAPGSWEPFL